MIYSFVCDECGVYVTQDTSPSSHGECEECESSAFEEQCRKEEQKD